MYRGRRIGAAIGRMAGRGRFPWTARLPRNGGFAPVAAGAHANPVESGNLIPDELRLGLEEAWPLRVVRHDDDGGLGHGEAGGKMPGRFLGFGMGSYPES